MAYILTLRMEKGSMLTYEELDENFLFLKQKVEALESAETSADAVLFTPQELTPGQKQIVWGNIGSMAVDFSNLPGNLSAEAKSSFKQKLDIPESFEIVDYVSYTPNQGLESLQQLSARSNINATDRRLEELASDLTEEERTKIRQKISATSIDDTQASSETTYSSNIIDQKLNLKLDVEDLDGLLTNPTYDNDTRIFTMDIVGGGTFTIDFPAESLISNVVLDDDNNLVFTFEDDSVVSIPLNTLLVGVVKSVNGKTPNAQGQVVINAEDIADLPSNYITTDTNQTGLSGNKSVDGTWTFNSQVNTANHGNSSQWKQAYDWGNYKQWGLGMTIGSPVITDGNAIVENGFYRSVGANAVNLPSNYLYAPIISVNRNALNYKIALATSSLGFQDGQNNWYDIWHTGNFNPAQYVLQSALNTQLANYVPINGVTTINNTKTFTASPVVPNATLNSHAVNLGQLNSALDGNYLPLAGGTMENGSVINWNSGAEAVIQQGGNNRIRVTFSNTFISASVTGTTDGIYLRPRGDINATGQVRINGNGQITTHSHGDSSQWHEAYLAIADKANTDGSNTTGGAWKIDNLKNDAVGFYVSTYSFDNEMIGIPSTDALGSADGMLLMRDGAPLAIAENINPDWDGYIYRSGAPNSGYPSNQQNGNYLIESKHRFRFYPITAPDTTSGTTGLLTIQPYNAIEHSFYRVTFSGLDIAEIDMKPPTFDELTDFPIERNAIGQKCTVAVSGSMTGVTFTSTSGADFSSHWNKGVFTFYWTGASWMFGGYSPIEP